MRLLPRPRRVPFPVADRTREGEPYRQYHPRLAAIDLLREKIADGQAGLDPYQPSDFIVVAGPNELHWVTATVNHCGLVLAELPQVDGGAKFRVVLEADVRHELGLDQGDPPFMPGEPLASRAVDAPRVYGGPTAVMDAVFGVLPDARPRLQIVQGEPISTAAMRAAKHAAALTLDCTCGAPAYTACRCSDDDRLASNTRSAS